MLQPGEVITASGDEFLVFCGGGSLLRVEELQLEGKRRMLVRDFINGLRPVAGDILGS
jgi:methionyl-tRNA formyltransferase